MRAEWTTVAHETPPFVNRKQRRFGRQPLFSLWDECVNGYLQRRSEAAQAVKRDGLPVGLPVLDDGFSRPASVAAQLAELALCQAQCLAAFADKRSKDGITSPMEPL